MVDLSAGHETLRQAVFDGLRAMNVELWHLDINYIPEGYEFLIVIDSENLTAKLCEQVAKHIYAALGAEGISKDNMFIDVSSPGVNRRLYDIRQCQAYIGSTICCHLSQGQQVKGLLRETLDEKLIIELPEGSICELEFSEAIKVNLLEVEL